LTVAGTETKPARVKRTDNYDMKVFKKYSVVLAMGAALSLAAFLDSRAADVLKPVAKAVSYDISDGGFVLSGWMGSVEKARPETVNANCAEDPHSMPFCTKITYKAGGVGWAAFAYQFPEQNWGDKSGRDLSGKGYKRVRVWARGATGREVVQWKAGGGTTFGKPHGASFEVEGDFVRLSKEWKPYTLDLKGANLSNVVSAFTIVFRENENPSGATVYLDDITYEP
jgi:hypothetical protein